MKYSTQGFLRVPDGAELFYEVKGEGALPVIFCDGLGCDGFIWKYLWPLLTARHPVTHWNYRGHGISTVPDDPTRIGMGFICDDLSRLMDFLKIPKAILFGHSMGTQVALEFHRRHPERVLGLVLLCGSYGNPLDTWHDHSLLRVAFPHIRRLVEGFPDAARALNRNFMGTELALTLAINGELNPDLISRSDFQPYMKHLQRMDPVMFIRTLDSLKDHSALDHLPSVNVPSIVVGGETDKFTPVWLAQRTAELIPKADYLLVPQGSHTAPLERPGMVNRAVDRFLRERVYPR